MLAEDVIETVEEADVAVSMEAAKLRHHPVTKAAGRLSELADQPPMFTLGTALMAAGLVAGRPRLAEAGGRMLASVALATVAKAAIKASVVRTRPNVVLDEGRYESGLWGPNEGPMNSFPSGHTANAVAAARALARAYPRLHGIGHVTAAAFGLIQVPRATHHPLDVAAGALVGYASEAVVDRLWPRVGPALDATLDALHGRA